MASTDSLESAFEEFRRSKKALQNIHEDTLRCFEKIEQALDSHKHGKELAQELTAEMSMARGTGIDDGMVLIDINGQTSGTITLTPLSQVLYTTEEREEVSSLFSQSPALIVVGQTNSGKSSIINEILKSRIVTTSDQPCTSRIVKLTYAKENYVRLVTQEGEELERYTSKDRKIPREMIELRECDRENPERVTATIEAGFDIPFLKSGVDIIDSPGRDENKVLDDLVREQIKNILAFIVYVIDGKNLFTNLDRAVLSELNERTKNLDIFYVVSKIEPQDQDSSDEEDEEEDDSDDDDHDLPKETVQQSKKRRVFEQLVKNGLIIEDDENPMNTHEYFHGLSAWKLSEYRHKKKNYPNWNDPDKKYKEYRDAFQRFQSCLKAFSESSLKRQINRSCQTLTSVLSRCLYYFIEKANSLKQHRDETIAKLEKIEVMENQVHNQVLEQVKKQRQEVVDALTEAVRDLKESVAREASTFQYSEEFTVPIRDGYVTGKEAVQQCKTQLETMVFNAVYKEIKDALLRMFSNRDNFYEDLAERVRKIEDEAASEENQNYGASQALNDALIKCYEVNPQLRSTTTLAEKAKKVFHAFWKALKQVCTSPTRAVKEAFSGKVRVGSEEWKRNTAVDTLTSIKVPEVADALVSNLEDHFEICHSQFKEMLGNIVKVFERGGTLKDDQRKVIHSFAPDVASLEMLCHSVKDHAEFGRPQTGEMIGAGAQGNVFDCTNITTSEGKSCVVKVVPVANENLLKDLTLELHTTRSLNHPNILPIVCTTIEPNSLAGIRVMIVSEKMKSDLHKALENLSSLRIRLKILLDVALALQYLHRKGLMHRDVKLQNVLVDEQNRGYLTDFGLCKPVGLVTGSLVGTPTAMAPEMIFQQYNKSVDVYAFGVLMWRVCEGKGNQPKNIILFPVPLIMLAVNAKEKRKPERLESFHPACWSLMEKCWVTNPDERPSLDEIVNDLKDILSDRSIT